MVERGTHDLTANAAAQKVRFCSDPTWHSASRAEANGHFISADVLGHSHVHTTKTGGVFLSVRWQSSWSECTMRSAKPTSTTDARIATKSQGGAATRGRIKRE